MIKMRPPEEVYANQSKYVYAGSEWDCTMLWDIVSPQHTPDAVMMPPLIFDFFAGVLFLCDLPLSFVADTICFPYDCYMVTLGGYERSGRKE